MIGTVRQVGYKFVVPSTRSLPDNSDPLATPRSAKIGAPA
jgi:hypothetical protein